VFAINGGSGGRHEDLADPDEQQKRQGGHSLVADPWGHVIARASDGVGIVSARLEPARVAAVRQDIPIARHKVLEG
jgi:predicted amidohydrolase